MGDLPIIVQPFENPAFVYRRSQWSGTRLRIHSNGDISIKHGKKIEFDFIEVHRDQVRFKRYKSDKRKWIVSELSYALHELLEPSDTVLICTVTTHPSSAEMRELFFMLRY
jgi:hypothetical protein